MSHHPSRAERWPRLGSSAFTALAALVFGSYALCCLLIWYEPEWRSHWDSALYLLTARSLAAGEGYQYLGEPFFLRPPGFSWLISQLPSQDVFDAAPYNRLVMAFAVTSIVAVYFALSPYVGRPGALAIAVLTGTNPVFANRFNWVLSEFPYTTALFGGFALTARMRPGQRRAWFAATGAAACFAAAFYLRTGALLVVPSLLLAISSRRWRAVGARLFAVAGVLLVASLPWFAYARHAADAATTPREQLLIADHATATFRRDPGDPASEPYSIEDWRKRIERHTVWAIGSVGASLVGSRTLWAGGLLLAVMTVGLLSRLRKGLSPLEWFALGSLALVLLYWYPSGRYLVPLLPVFYLLVAECIDVLERGLRPWIGPIPRGALVVVALTGFALSNSAQFGKSFGVHYSDGFFPTLRDERDSMSQVADWIRRHTDPEATLLCHDAPMYALLTGRRAYTYRFRPGPHLLEKYEPDVVLLDRGGLPSGLMQMMLGRLGVEPIELPATRARLGGVRVYPMTDLAWGEEGP